MVINVLDLVPHCYTWADGEIVGRAIHRALSKKEKVTVSFAGVEDVPTSFVNAAFVKLLEDFDYALIREKLAVVNSTRQINDMIKRRLDFEARRAASA
jgi:hypothetical protein